VLAQLLTIAGAAADQLMQQVKESVAFFQSAILAEARYQPIDTLSFAMSPRRNRERF
jgi:hypothetical protein